MGINLVIAVGDWFEMLRQQPNLSELNFWAPSAGNFRALQPGEMFLFKLHSPRNVIVGGGIFAYPNALPCSLAWEAFREANGARSAQEMRSRIARYRRADPTDQSDFEVGCRILTQPFFFDERDWIPVPASWSPNIVSFKTYNTGNVEGLALWEAVTDRLNRPQIAGMTEEPSRFGEPQLIRPRLGQGAFRVLVTDIYRRRCAVTQERTLPALEAAHIRPYADSYRQARRIGRAGLFGKSTKTLGSAAPRAGTNVPDLRLPLLPRTPYIYTRIGRHGGHLFLSLDARCIISTQRFR